MTARIPASCFETATPPRSQALVGNGRLGGNERTSAFQIQFERPPKRMKSPIVRMTPLITRLPLDRAHDDPLERDPADERDQDRQPERAPVADAVVDERPGDEGRERGHLALGEVHDAGRAVDDHDRRARAGRRSSPEASPATTCCRNSVKSVPEVGVADGLVLGQLGARAFQRDPPDLEHVRAARRAQRELRVLLDDEDGQPSFSFRSPRIRKISRTTIGASPSDGSSSSRSRGRDMSARAIASICCSPPESVPACCWRRASRNGKSPHARS